MKLGENIYRLRTQKNLSQGDLADALEVSRQSVSKWENNSAVPELEKLMKMSELFGVTLDQLVTPNVQPAPPAKESPPETAPETAPETPSKPASSIPGIMLLCFAMLTFLLTGVTGLLLIIPLAVCGILCLCLHRRRGLWCCWFLLSYFVMLNTGSFQTTPFWNIFLYVILEDLNIAHFLTTLIFNIVTVVMSVWTIQSYLPSAIRHVQNRRPRLVLGWCLTVIPEFLSGIVSACSHAYLTGVINYGSTFLFFHIDRALVLLHLAGVLTMTIFTAARIQAKSTSADSITSSR